MKRFIIWLFRLNNLQSLYIAERQRQRRWDEKEYLEKIANVEEKYEKEISLIQQSYEADKAMMIFELNKFKKREKELYDREYNVKIANKKNLNMAAQLSDHIFNIANYFQKEAGEVKKFIDLEETEKKYYLE